ncbi:MAG: DNA methyltransferase [Candidatus Edwardsbacteria bacterium]
MRFAGTGTTLAVAYQLERNSIGIEIDPENVKIIENRLKYPKPADDISQSRHRRDYRYTPDLEKSWPGDKHVIAKQN